MRNRVRFVALALASTFTAIHQALIPSASLAEEIIASQTLGNVRVEVRKYKGQGCINGRQIISLEIVENGRYHLWGERGGTAYPGYSYPLEGCFRNIQIVNLDKDKEQEVVLNYHTGGNHCCMGSIIWDFNEPGKSSNIYTWNGHGYRFEDLDGDGAQEFVSNDTNFNHQFSSGAYSGLPVQIWQLRKWKRLDVTRQFPQAIRKDAEKQWGYYKEAEASKGETAGFLAAYLADQYLLGSEEAAKGWLGVALAYQGNDRPQFLFKLHTFLQKTGYAKGVDTVALKNKVYEYLNNLTLRGDFGNQLRLYDAILVLDPEHRETRAAVEQGITTLFDIAAFRDLLTRDLPEISSTLRGIIEQAKKRWQALRGQGEPAPNISGSGNTRNTPNVEDKPPNNDNGTTPPGGGSRSPSSPVSPELPPDINRVAMSNASVQGQLRSIGEPQKGGTVNEEIRKITGNPSDFHPPFTPDATVTHSQTTGETLFVRFSGGDFRPDGSYMMRLEDVQGLTPAQIRDKFAIPTDNPMTEMSAVKVRSGAEMYSGSANKHQEWGNGGGTQYYLPGGRKDIIETIPIKKW